MLVRVRNEDSSHPEIVMHLGRIHFFSKQSLNHAERRVNNHLER